MASDEARTTVIARNNARRQRATVKAMYEEVLRHSTATDGQAPRSQDIELWERVTQLYARSRAWDSEMPTPEPGA